MKVEIDVFANERAVARCVRSMNEGGDGSRRECCKLPAVGDEVVRCCPAQSWVYQGTREVLGQEVGKFRLGLIATRCHCKRPLAQEVWRPRTRLAAFFCTSKNGRSNGGGG